MFGQQCESQIRLNDASYREWFVFMESDKPVS